jgi:hypothetical protein
MLCIFKTAQLDLDAMGQITEESWFCSQQRHFILLLHGIQTGSGPMGERISFSKGKVVVA